jgi:hypothetical protein
VLALETVLLVAIPVALALLFPGKYQFATGTVLAAVVGGQLRVLRSTLAAALSALADRRGLALWNAVSWLTLVVAFMAAALGSAWGLQGLLWGLAISGAANVGASVLLLIPHLR